MRNIDFLEGVARLEEVEEDGLIDTVLGEIEVESVYRRFIPVFPRNIPPGTTRGEDKQNAIHHRAMVCSRPSDVRFLRREIFLDDFPEIVINFLERHDPCPCSSGVL